MIQVALGLTLALGAGLFGYLLWALLRASRAQAVSEEVAAARPELLEEPEADPDPPTGVRPDDLRRCIDCRHFDLVEGQAAIRSSGVFAQVTQIVPMAEMGAEVDEEGRRRERDIPLSASWAESGMCRKRHEILWGGTDHDRRARMAGGDKGEIPGGFIADGDCWETP